MRRFKNHAPDHLLQTISQVVQQLLLFVMLYATTLTGTETIVTFDNVPLLSQETHTISPVQHLILLN